MDDIENLSKEELIALLKLQKSSTKKTPPKGEAYGICKYTAGKGKTECTEEASTPYGFCKKHIRTVQAKKAKDEYDAAQIIDKSPIIKSPILDDFKPKSDNKEENPAKKSKVKEVETIPKGKKQPLQGKVTFAPIESPQKSTPKSKKGKVSNKPPQKEKKVSKNNTSKKIPAARSKTILPNFWGNYEDTETKIVFDPKTKEAIGVQEKGGAVSALKPEHVAICTRNGWNYILPYSSEEGSDDSDDNDKDNTELSSEESDETESLGSSEESRSDDDEKEESQSGEKDEESEDEESEDEDDENDEDDEEDDDEEVYGSSSSS